MMVWVLHLLNISPTSCDNDNMNKVQYHHFDGLAEKRRSSSTLAMELRLFSIKPSIFYGLNNVRCGVPFLTYFIDSTRYGFS